MLSYEERIAKLNQMIKENDNIVFFGGAGVSTESGIPDFRSKDGLYNQHDVKFDQYQPEYLLSIDCLVREPKVFFEYYRQKLDTSDIMPNTGHYQLAKLEQSGKNLSIITQNIDGLHQKAGSKRVYEIHGSTLRNYCMKCHSPLPVDAIYGSKEAIPTCPICGKGMVRPDVTLYGEMLPEQAWSASVKAIKEADVLIVAGTSLTVYPAAGLVEYYRGDKMVLINRDETGYDKYADLLFRENCGKVLGDLDI